MRILGARDRVDDSGEITRSIETYRCGLVPFFAKDPSVGNRAFYTRAETLATKAMFSAAFKKSRLLMPTDAVFEWKKEGKHQAAYLFALGD